MCVTAWQILLLSSQLQHCISFLVRCNKLPQMWWFKTTHNLLSHNLCGSGVQLGSLLMVSQGCNQGIVWAVFSSGGWTREESSNLTQVAGRKRFFVGPRALVFSWISAGSYPQHLRDTTVSRGHLSHVLSQRVHFIKRERRVSSVSMLENNLT